LLPDSAHADYLDTLNPAQREAAVHGRQSGGGYLSGPLLVIAGAGTGKTMTLAHRVAHLVVRGVDPERILLLTFTRRAAQTMNRRVEAIVRTALPGPNAGPARLPWSGTFHSIGNRLLRRFARNLGLAPSFSVLDRGDAADLMDVVRQELGLSARDRRFPRKDTCLAIYSRCVNARESLEHVVETRFPWCVDWTGDLQALFRDYVERKQAIEALDYDDLLLYWLELVSEAEFAHEIGAWFDHVLVDEYQDTNLLQAGILAAIKPDGTGVTVVGDDAQSIYSFRAAEVDNILGFADRFAPPATVVKLEHNYRSTQPILDSANTLINAGKRQYSKHLVTDRRDGARPAHVTVEDGDAEADYVVGRVLAAREAGTGLRDQAVLFRSSHHSDRLELELVRRNIPYVKYGGLKLLEAAHVKDFLAILKWGANPKNEIAAFRVLKLLPGIGPGIAARCFEHLAVAGYDVASLAAFSPPAAAASAWRDLCQLLATLAGAAADEPHWQAQIDAVNRWYRPLLAECYEAADTRSADLDQLGQISARYATRERFLTELTLDPPSAAGNQAGDPLLDEDYLVLSTVHSAKGQEWDAVYVLNVTDGNFPSEFAAGDAARIEEERRLLYVAMTRAKRTLSLIEPLRFYVTEQHRDGDAHVFGARSRFMTDALLATMERQFHGVPADGSRPGRPATGRRIDAAARMRDMWK